MPSSSHFLIDHVTKFLALTMCVRVSKNRKPNWGTRFCTLAKMNVGQSGTKGQTICCSNQWKTKLKNRFWTRLKPEWGLSAGKPRTVREPRNNTEQIAWKLPPTKIRSICGQIKTNCHQILTTWSQGKRWAIPKRSSPNLKPINGKLDEHKKHWFLNPRSSFAPIYELMRN